MRTGLSLLLALVPLAVWGQAAPGQFRLLCWNILHGGRDDGAEAGPRRTAEVIRESGADVVALQETYGSGELLAKALGMRLHARGTNVSILTRFEILEDISVFEEFKCVGALLRLPDGSRVAVYSIWLPFSGEIWEPGTRDTSDVAKMLAACAASEPDLRAVRDQVEARLSGPQYAGVPVVVAGDFNSMSHLDYGEAWVDEHKAVVAWPTGKILPEAGYTDAYRQCNPLVDRKRDRTWTPRFPEQEEDRIDFVYYRGAGLRAESAQVVERHPEKFPSDHAAVLVSFRYGRAGEGKEPTALRVATYNIRHGRGMDGRLDLDRTAKALAGLEAAVVALQEVDLGVARSGGANQPRELARALGMHACFGSFMPHDGGLYGMALLSQFPLVDVEPFRLPEGNEPRVALFARLRLPDGEVLTVVGVHFDWVEDDAYRYAQALAVAGRLRKAEGPWVLLGDFNDGPDSRVLALFRGLGREAPKPSDGRMTFDAASPSKEIDYVFAGPPSRWDVGPARVVPEAAASDHRPVVAELRLLPREAG